ncbi:MAG: hypothetical protein ACI8ZM_000778 [Crocinitomix sp.]|jgi:hypothetical protein
MKRSKKVKQLSNFTEFTKTIALSNVKGGNGSEGGYPIVDLEDRI